ncbi:MAG: hypothetical protein ACRCYW_12925, partial [Aeromonas sp.]|uniref:hypothetical protein n=1 Tax=Aeromonas sp. TaxID=647 RepID=UPI003F2EC047
MDVEGTTEADTNQAPAAAAGAAAEEGAADDNAAAPDQQLPATAGAHIPNLTTSAPTITIPGGYAYNRQANTDATEADKAILDQERDLAKATEMLIPQDTFQDAIKT